MWYAIVEKTTGKLVSTTTVVPDSLKSNLETVELDKEPIGRISWDKVQKEFVDFPSPIIKDKLEDFLNHTKIKTWLASLTDNQRKILKETLLDVWGEMRFYENG